MPALRADYQRPAAVVGCRRLCADRLPLTHARAFTLFFACCYFGLHYHAYRSNVAARWFGYAEPRRALTCGATATRCPHLLIPRLLPAPTVIITVTGPVGSRLDTFAFTPTRWCYTRVDLTPVGCYGLRMPVDLDPSYKRSLLLFPTLPVTDVPRSRVTFPTFPPRTV